MEKERIRRLQAQRQKMQRAPTSLLRAAGREGAWHDVYSDDGLARAHYRGLIERFDAMDRRDLNALGDRLDATMREMDVTFNIARAAGSTGAARRPWTCDVLPHVFAPEEWELIARGAAQRLRAFELFLRDVYGPKEILRHEIVPLRPVLGSPGYLHPAIGVPPSAGSYLHLCSLVLTRALDGRWMVKSHQLTRTAGLSYMIQNRRILARVNPDIFEGTSVASIADTPLEILDQLQALAPTGSKDFTAVLLTPGPGSPVYSEHSFLARRTGLQLAVGSDLVVLNDKVYLKIVGGLEQVELIYTRLREDYLDPLVCRRDSLLGVPGLIHCLRRGSVAMVNSLGSELADDRALLCFSNQIIRFYLGEAPILPTLPTYWMGDPDQREVVLSDLGRYRIRRLTGEDVLGSWRGLPPSAKEELAIRQALKHDPQGYVAQIAAEGAETVCFDRTVRQARVQDHVLFALRRGDRFDLVPGALTRTSGDHSLLTSLEAGGGSKDSWVLESPSTEHGEQAFGARPRARAADLHLGERIITSRVAESCYWLGRYLERLNHLSVLIQTIETIELEELNPAERKLYRPVWSRLLPPLETPSKIRRGLGSRLERYQLLLKPDEPDSGASLAERGYRNGEAVQECLTPEAWAILAELHDLFDRRRFRTGASETLVVRTTRRLSEGAARLVPQFFATMEATMLADEGRHLCLFGRMLERASITAHSVFAVQNALSDPLERSPGFDHATEIELSAFLRLLGTRDAYRRVYQMRAQPLHVLEILWQNPEAPRSVMYCLGICADILREPAVRSARGTGRVQEHIAMMLDVLRRVHWQDHLGAAAGGGQLEDLLSNLYALVRQLHEVVSDNFLNHQAFIPNPDQGVLQL